jgi:hypothetical protein
MRGLQSPLAAIGRNNAVRSGECPISQQFRLTTILDGPGEFKVLVYVAPALTTTHYWNGSDDEVL